MIRSFLGFHQYYQLHRQNSVALPQTDQKPFLQIQKGSISLSHLVLIVPLFLKQNARLSPWQHWGNKTTKANTPTITAFLCQRRQATSTCWLRASSSVELWEDNPEEEKWTGRSPRGHLPGTGRQLCKLTMNIDGAGAGVTLRASTLTGTRALLPVSCSGTMQPAAAERPRSQSWLCWTPLAYHTSSRKTS